jgi:hypothetical protein
MNKNFGSGFEQVDLLGEIIDWDDDEITQEYDDSMDWEEYHHWLIETEGTLE